MEVICGLSMPVHSLLSRNDLQLICSQGQEPKGNFSPSLHRFLVDYNKLITNSNLVKQLVLPEGRWFFLSHYYLLLKFSLSPRYGPCSKCAEVHANKDEWLHAMHSKR